MTETTFFRLLDVDIDDKGTALQAQIAALNDEPRPPEAADLEETGEIFTADPAEFSKIPKSPFAYWVGESIRRLFVEMPSVEERGISVQHGASTKRDFRFLRLWWEVSPDTIGSSAEDTYKGRPWVHFAKGGAYSLYYSDVHLLVDWTNEAEKIEEYVLNRYPYLNGNASWILHPENDYFKSGLTWTRRTSSSFSVRALPKGCIFADKGPSAFPPDVNSTALLSLLVIINSSSFEMLLRLQLGAATAAARSYEIGIIQRTPLPSLTDHPSRLAPLTREAHNLQRSREQGNEVTHAFGVPDLVRHRDVETLRRAGEILDDEDQATDARLADIQDRIDEIVFDLYEMDESDRALVREEMSDTPDIEHETEITTRVENLLMWCVGVAFGRWDVRKALDPSRLPSLGDPFDPLPHCAPGALVGEDGLPLAKGELPDDYPLPIAWDGILVDDSTHRSDIVTRVRGVLRLLWGERADGIEAEICEILGVEHLRDYFRDYRHGFFDFHAKRYSKSRRKAPIYWLLQSEDRHYAIWLYYHRLSRTLPYAAGRDYADAKVALEQGRLEQLQEGAETLEGSARRRRQREIERQTGIVEDVTAFRDALDEIALLDLTYDLNDGVLLNIAPFHELVPWKYADRTWERLQEGRYDWSSMARQLREKELINCDD
jgi:hypothetical protein